MESPGNLEPCSGPHLFPKDLLPSSFPQPWWPPPQGSYSLGTYLLLWREGPGLLWGFQKP